MVQKWKGTYTTPKSNWRTNIDKILLKSPVHDMCQRKIWEVTITWIDLQLAGKWSQITIIQSAESIHPHCIAKIRRLYLQVLKYRQKYLFVELGKQQVHSTVLINKTLMPDEDTLRFPGCTACVHYCAYITAFGKDEIVRIFLPLHSHSQNRVSRHIHYKLSICKNEQFITTAQVNGIADRLTPIYSNSSKMWRHCFCANIWSWFFSKTSRPVDPETQRLNRPATEIGTGIVGLTSSRNSSHG